jgi:Tfp pilus assembly PilM family ATPase
MNSRTSSFANFFTAPVLPRRAISIEPQYIAVASVARKRGRITVTNAAFEPLPAGVIEPRFAELNIKDKDRLSGALAHALEKAGLMRERRWSLAIPRKATRTFIIQLDEVPKSNKDRSEVLQWKVERLLEVSMSDLTAAFQRLQPTDGHERYLVVAASNEVLASYEAVLAPLKIEPGFVIPSHLAEAAWLQLEPTARDTLLIAAEPEELTIMFRRGGDFLSLRSVEFATDSVSDEIHRTLVYYMDKLVPDGIPRLETILLIGPQLNVGDVKASCRDLFPMEQQPVVNTLRDERLDSGITWEAIASAAGLAAMGL